MKIILILSLFFFISCGKDRTKEQIKENNITLKEAKKEATDPLEIASLDAAIAQNNKELAEYAAIEEAVNNTRIELAATQGIEPPTVEVAKSPIVESDDELEVSKHTKKEKEKEEVKHVRGGSHGNR